MCLLLTHQVVGIDLISNWFKLTGYPFFDLVRIRIDSISIRIESISTRIDSISTRIESISTQIDSISNRIQSTSTRKHSISTRILNIAMYIVYLRAYTSEGQSLYVAVVVTETLNRQSQYGLTKRKISLRAITNNSQIWSFFYRYLVV